MSYKLTKEKLSQFGVPVLRVEWPNAPKNIGGMDFPVPPNVKYFSTRDVMKGNFEALSFKDDVEHNRFAQKAGVIMQDELRATCG